MTVAFYTPPVEAKQFPAATKFTASWRFVEMNRKAILALGLALSSGAVLAQSGGQSGSERQSGAEGLINAPVNATASDMFSGLDLNTDRILSLDEVTANPALSDAFRTLDLDSSGGLTDGEFAKFEELTGSSSGSSNSRGRSSESSGASASTRSNEEGSQATGASGRSGDTSASGSARSGENGTSASGSADPR